MHTLLAASQSSRNKENLNASSTSLASASATSLYGSYTPTSVLRPSARRQFEGKEGSHHPPPSSSHHTSSSSGQHRLSTVNYPLHTLSQLSPSPTPHSQTPRSNHPRARFTIGPAAEERGRRGRGSGDENTRGRGLGRKSVGGGLGGIGLSLKELSLGGPWGLDEAEEEERERGRDRRGRKEDVKVLQQSSP